MKMKIFKKNKDILCNKKKEKKMKEGREEREERKEKT